MIKHNVILSCEPGHFIASLDVQGKTLEGFGDTMSDSLYELAEEISIEELRGDFYTL
jgi:hypothetical protein